MKNKKKFFSFASILMLIVISINIQADNNYTDNTSLTNIIINVSFQFPSPLIMEDSNGSSIHLNNLNTYHTVPGEPILPISVEIIELPLGAHIKDVICKTSDTKEYKITKDVISYSLVTLVLQITSFI